MGYETRYVVVSILGSTSPYKLTLEFGEISPKMEASGGTIFLDNGLKLSRIYVVQLSRHKERILMKRKGLWTSTYFYVFAPYVQCVQARKWYLWIRK